MIEILGWAGFAGLMLFYWRLGSGRVLSAYLFGTAGATAWLAVGVLLQCGYVGMLPSLVATEAAVIVMNVRGIMQWRRKALKEAA